MKYDLKNHFRKMEAEREKLISLIDKLDDKGLNFIPAPGKWSILQILFHIVKAEHLTIFSIKNNLNKQDKLENSTSGSFIRSFLLNISLKSSMKLKAPQILQKVPETYDIEQLKKKWSTLRGELKKIIGNIDENLLNKYIFEHPYSGKLNFTQSLKFLDAHTTHHKKQIIRIMNRQQDLK